MLTFVTLSRATMQSKPLSAPVQEIETKALQEIRRRCPEVEWLHNRETQRENSYHEIFITPDIETAEEVAEIIGTFGYAIPEVWTATDPDTYRRMLKRLPKIN